MSFCGVHTVHKRLDLQRHGIPRLAMSNSETLQTAIRESLSYNHGCPQSSEVLSFATCRVWKAPARRSAKDFPLDGLILRSARGLLGLLKRFTRIALFGSLRTYWESQDIDDGLHDNMHPTARLCFSNALVPLEQFAPCLQCSSACRMVCSFFCSFSPMLWARPSCLLLSSSKALVTLVPVEPFAPFPQMR